MQQQQPDHHQAVRQWCLSLIVLSAVSISRDEAETKLAAYVSLLTREFPAGAFTADSLAHVAARASKGFPTFGEIVQALRPWWADHRPVPPMLPPPERVPVHAAVATPEEREYVRALVEGVAARIRATDDDTVAGAQAFGAAYLSPGVLDQINPLPNGRKRSEAAS
jgi:hypothetical protein